MRAAIIGAGVIGLSWAELFREAGWDVAIYDPADSPLPHGLADARVETLEDAVRGADLVQENGPERLDVKRELLAAIAASAGDGAIIASSTSSLLPSLLAEGNPRAAQIVVGHPYNPPRVMPLVEIVPGPLTDPAVVDRVERIYRSLGRVPVALNAEIPGFVGNRVQKAVLDEAQWLVQQGIVDAGAFDTIVRESLGLRWASIGVFEASHLGGGPGGIRHLMEHVGAALDDIELQRPSRDPAALAAVADDVEARYGTADSYAARAARRDRITTAVREAVHAQSATPVLYGLDIARGCVVRIDTADGGVRELVSGLGEAPDGLVVDEDGGRIVFTLMGEPDAEPVGGGEPAFTRRNGSLQWIGLGGGEPGVLVSRGSFTTGKQLARDAGTGRLYWSDREGRGLYRCEADGSGLTRLLDTTGTGPSEVEEWCVGIAVDPAAGQLYWTQKGGAKAGQGRIRRAPLAMTGDAVIDPASVETLWEGLPEPIDLVIDGEAGMLYWTDRGAGPDGNSLNRAPIPAEGERGARPVVLSRGYHEAIGLALDTAAHRAYVSDLSGAIREVELATGRERTVAVLDGSATGLALLREN
ncbi:3-hydroxyacyl-CoA dehydrogenase [Mycetocola reblochoni REB411]|uniref:3-hydroxyacyl-CoA dehydrogenase n=2 Tax=Mycetocola reblochoni TaxID=331618 RepID=A0A1R4IS70_9MICO|nr:3-hydroxyacyl-CoA dehydrogenase [Mycetocola reblochoni REB411]